ncbi:MAG: methionyl-tRNA formyltransferase [Planctomycetota bacterium]
MILMGTGPFAVPAFDAIASDKRHEVLMVVTRPQPPVKSRGGPPPAPVRDWAESHGFSIMDPPSINDDEVCRRLAETRADLLVVCDYGQILKPHALATSRRGGINLHGSLLPRYRGAAPVQRALLSGEPTTGVSVIHMTPRLDGGPILAEAETPIGSTETAGQLEERLSELGVEPTLRAVELLEQWDGTSPIGRKQDPAAATKAPRLSKAEGRIDWNQSGHQLSCHIRGMQPWPVAFVEAVLRGGKPPVRIAIRRAEFRPDLNVNENSIGHTRDSDGLEIGCRDGWIAIARLQPSGKKEMSAEEFLRGHPLPPGTPFGAAE